MPVERGRVGQLPAEQRDLTHDDGRGGAGHGGQFGGRGGRRRGKGGANDAQQPIERERGRAADEQRPQRSGFGPGPARQSRGQQDQQRPQRGEEQSSLICAQCEQRIARQPYDNRNDGRGQQAVGQRDRAAAPPQPAAHADQTEQPPQGIDPGRIGDVTRAAEFTPKGEEPAAQQPACLGPAPAAAA